MRKIILLSLSILALLIGCAPQEPILPINETQQVEPPLEVTEEENGVTEEPAAEEVEERKLVPLKKPLEEVYAFKKGYKTYDPQSYNIRIEIDPDWKVRKMKDTSYFPGVTLYRGWDDTWRNQIRLGLIHNVGQSINLKDFDEVTQYYEDYLRGWCADTQENPVWEVSPTEEGWTTCLEMGDFTFKEVTVHGRQAFQVSYDLKDEFRLPGGEYTEDVYSDWINWENLIPYGDDLILASGYTIAENVDEQKDIILYSINSLKILNVGQPIFENTEPVRETGGP